MLTLLLPLLFSITTLSQQEICIPINEWHQNFYLPSEKSPQFIYHRQTGKTMQHFTLLYLIQDGQNDILQQLLTNNFIPQECFFNEYNQSALHIACFPDTISTETFKVLLTYQFSPININSTNNSSAIDTEIYILHSLLTQNQIEKCCCFLTYAKNINVNTQDCSGLTPLHIATKKNFIPIIKLLLDYGANPWIRCNKNMLPVHYLQDDNDPEVYKLLWTTMSSTICNS